MEDGNLSGMKFEIIRNGRSEMVDFCQMSIGEMHIACERLEKRALISLAANLGMELKRIKGGSK